MDASPASTSAGRVPIRSAAAWRPADIAEPSEWAVVLTEAERLEIVEAVRIARAAGTTSASIDAGSFPLPTLAGRMGEKLDPATPAFRAAESEVETRLRRLLGIRGKRTVDSIHRELGRVMWDECGMERNAAGLERALARIPALRDEFWNNVNVLGGGESLNQALEKAGRVADYLELGELMCRDALERTESCGGHYRVESQTAEGEALRDDERFAHVAAWEWNGTGGSWTRHREELDFEYVHLAQRSYR